MYGAYIFPGTIWQVDWNVREHATKVGSQRHFARFLHTDQPALLHARTLSSKRVVIGDEDRFVHFGYDWFEQFCERHGTQITVINDETFSPEEELVRDLIAIVTVFSGRLHGLRSHQYLIRAAALGKDITDDQGTQDQTASQA